MQKILLITVENHTLYLDAIQKDIPNFNLNQHINSVNIIFHSSKSKYKANSNNSNNTPKYNPKLPRS